MTASSEHGGAGRRPSLHIFNHKQGAESKVGVGGSYGLSKPTFNDILLPAKLHFFTVPK